jgi:hypothetical protein|nr:MAG TPA: hypothetical protein [Bacteriophage sp.]
MPSVLPPNFPKVFPKKLAPLSAKPTAGLIEET